MSSSADLYNRMIAISAPTGVPYKNAKEAEALYKGVARD